MLTKNLSHQKSPQFFLKNGSIKLALELEVMKKSIHKNKYQMPNIDSLIRLISQYQIANVDRNRAYFTALGLQRAYSQLNLQLDTPRHCHFNIISGRIMAQLEAIRFIPTHRYSGEFHKIYRQ